MNGLQIRGRLHGGIRVYGTLVVSNSPHWVSMVDQIGVDFVFIDTEHIALDRTTLAWMCQAYAAKGKPPLVRIPRPDPFEASMALDGGACGVIAPYIETPAQVRDLVGAVKFKPLKGKRLKQALEDPTCIEPRLREYLAESSAYTILIANIESAPALKNLDAILAVEGLDAVLVGPPDLSCSLGIPEQYDNERFLEAVDSIIDRARAQGIGAGVHAFSAPLARHELRWARRGANLIVHGADITASCEKLTEDFRGLRQELGDTATQPHGHVRRRD
jgi:4-hydroxy-2-oxoheptanedioate aldolase